MPSLNFSMPTWSFISTRQAWHTILAVSLLALVSPCDAAFDLTFEYPNPNGFSQVELGHLEDAFATAEQLFENVILGHQGTDEDVVFNIRVFPDNDGLASAQANGFNLVGDFTMASSGSIFVNTTQVIPMATGFGDLGNGENFLDDVMAHEIGHAIGFGTRWVINGVYQNGSGEYTGQHAVAAYRDEFVADAEFVPVELAGSVGSANSHWNQLFRSSPQEGNPDDPLSLSPLTGILDARGRDFAQDLMSPAVDPDFGEPFLSNTTVQSLRDIGYAVVAQFPIPGDLNADGLVNVRDIDFLGQVTRQGTDDLFFDLDTSGAVDGDDRFVWFETAETLPGDSNFDSVFNSSDLIEVFRQATYEDDIAGNATWSSGDWNGDSEFDASDLVYAFQFGGYDSAEPLQAIQSVPEPNELLGLAVFSTLFLLKRQTPTIDVP